MLPDFLQFLFYFCLAGFLTRLASVKTLDRFPDLSAALSFIH